MDKLFNLNLQTDGILYQRKIWIGDIAHGSNALINEVYIPSENLCFNYCSDNDLTGTSINVYHSTGIKEEGTKIKLQQSLVNSLKDMYKLQEKLKELKSSNATAVKEIVGDKIFWPQHRDRNY
jgi:hypothetical protein